MLEYAAEGEPAEPPLAPSMREHAVRLARQSVVYGLGGITLQVVGLVTFPVLARVFAPSQYGILELAAAASTVLIVLVDAGMASAAQRSYYDYDDSRREERRVVLTTGLAFTTLVGLALAAVGILAREPLSAWIFRSREHANLVVLIAVTVPVTNAASYLRNAMRLRFQAWHYTASTALAAVAGAAALLVAVLVFDLGVEGVYVGTLAGQALGLLYALVVTRSALARRVSSTELRTMVAYALPLIPGAIAMWALMLLDRFMLGRLSNLGQVGQYAAANRMASVLLLAITAFASAYGPYAFSIYSRDRELEKQVRSRMLTYLTAVLTLAALVVTLFSRELLELLAPGYDTAYEAVGPVMLGIVAYGLSSIVVAGISITRRTVWFAVLTPAAALVNIALNVALIPALAMVGAAVATAVAFWLLTAGQYVVAQRLYPTPYDPRLVLTIVAVGTALGPAGLVHLDNEAVTLLVKTAALACFFVLLALLGVADRKHLERLRAVLAGALRLPEAGA